jgi:hypothetical protein
MLRSLTALSETCQEPNADFVTLSPATLFCDLLPPPLPPLPAPQVRQGGGGDVIKAKFKRRGSSSRRADALRGGKVALPGNYHR